MIRLRGPCRVGCKWSFSRMSLDNQKGRSYSCFLQSHIGRERTPQLPEVRMKKGRKMRKLGILVLLWCSLTVYASAQWPQSPSTTPVSITLGTPVTLFHLDSTDAMGMSNVPDMHIAPLQLPDSSYLVFIAGSVGGPKAGATGMLSTSDFLTYRNAGQGTATKVEPVLDPSCPGNPGDSSCWQEYDADYAGANFVWRAKNGDLFMLYEGECRTFGSSPPNIGSPGYDVIALARSTDGGVSWMRMGPVITGTDPKSVTQPISGQPGVPEGGSIIANGYIYSFFPYLPNDTASVSHIQVARSPVDSDGAAGTWTKYYNGTWP